MLTRHPDGVTIAVKLTPKASRDALVRLETTSDGKKQLRASVTAVPEKGKANAALIKFLAKQLRLPKTSLQVLKGGQSQHKTILITGSTDEILLQLKNKFHELGIID